MDVLAALGDKGLAAGVGILAVYSWFQAVASGGGVFYFIFLFCYHIATLLLLFAGIGACFLVLMWRLSLWGTGGDANWEPYLEVHDAALAQAWKGKKIPIETFIEAYIDMKANFKGDVLDTLWNHRHEIFQFCFTLNHLPFILKRFVPIVLTHTKEMDKKDIQEVYDRGNDFYNYFLGESMLYTSGLFNSPNDTLEEAQKNKMELACRKIHLQENEKLLDIGCGWGTFACYAAGNYNAQVTGITISEQGTLYGKNQAKEKNVEGKVDILCLDYRDIPEQKWDKITCFEMAEHVGVKNFRKFLSIVDHRLKDDGIFYLQIAGLRRAWQFEDLIWGLFMNKYIFPGADASCPLNWYVAQCEAAGFEVRSVETIGIHYSMTIRKWYNNWIQNKDKVEASYGKYWYRLWSVFLGWSVIASGQGSATCYQIVMHKNTSSFPRQMFVGKRV